jgi:hypothetical protein
LWDGPVDYASIGPFVFKTATDYQAIAYGFAVVIPTGTG